MNNKEIDDIQYALKEVFTIYGKELEDQVARLWIKSLSGKPVHLLMKAIAEYPKFGKYAPRPIDILDLVDKFKVEVKAHQPVHHEPHNGSPRIAQAWSMYLRKAHGFEMPSSQALPAMDFGEALEIVNREALKYNSPESIEPEFRLQQYFR